MTPAVTGGTVPAPSEVQGLAAVMNLLAKIDVDTLLGLSRAPEDRDDRMHVGYSEAATRLNIPEKWLRERIGSLPHRKFGKFVQFAEEDLRAISEMHRVVPNSDGRTKDEPSTETLRPSKRSRRNS
ncbi:helix-turn-helix domain-containing protein [Streptomyces albidoflavus]|uniref:Helix-turn-helix domain-containing protein n=1 Tax=Streptomyces wadayamensis TaxID=141454 RepID=A0ABR4S5N0_9ACTN|nr:MULTISPECIES: helix-turn-helix domain-containing protein [Streptomyces]KDR60948.1 hypothetical protein DC60_02900 [Streptomyces wadayamensis]